MLLLELVLVLVAQIDDALHVHFVERRQDRVVLLRLQQALGHARAQAAHGHALLRAAIERGRERHRDSRRRGAGWRSRRLSRDRRLRAKGIALGDATAAARTFDGPGGNALLCQDLGGGRGSHGGTRSRLRSGGRGCRLRSSRRGRSRLRRLSGAGLTFGVDTREHFTRSHQAAITLDDFGEYAGRRGRNFENHLVGLDFDQDFICLDCLARLLLPGEQRRFGHRLGQLGDNNIGHSHYFDSVI